MSSTRSACAKRSMSQEDYEHIWEGKPRTVAEGAIYAMKSWT
ncbi:hypothetical protein N1Z41_00035915 [Pseudomonas aeruginosa]